MSKFSRFQENADIADLMKKKDKEPKEVTTTADTTSKIKIKPQKLKKEVKRSFTIASYPSTLEKFDKYAKSLGRTRSELWEESCQILFDIFEESLKEE